MVLEGGESVVVTRSVDESLLVEVEGGVGGEIAGGKVSRSSLEEEESTLVKDSRSESVTRRRQDFEENVVVRWSSRQIKGDLRLHDGVKAVETFGHLGEKGGLDLLDSFEIIRPSTRTFERDNDLVYFHVLGGIGEMFELFQSTRRRSKD